MKNRILLLFLLLASYGFGVVFPPHYFLPGYQPIIQNRFDYLKMHKGFSISEFPRAKLGESPITTEAEIDYDNNLVTLVPKLSNIQLDQPRYLDVNSYFSHSFNAVFRNKLKQKTQETLGNTERTNDAGLIPEIVIELPKIALPRVVRKFMGNKAGRLSLDGSQRLTLAGSKTTRNEQGSEDDENDDFDVVLQQDLNLQLSGTIGEKIHVDVHHQSTSDENVIATPTEVNISYDGDEDEIVQSIEGGNIALSLSGSRFISYSVSSEGLFGIKANMKAGNLNVTTIMGKDEAQKSTQKYRGNAAADSVTIDSRSYIKRLMFFVDDPHALYSLSTDDEIRGYKNNKVELSDAGGWTVKNHGLLPQSGSVIVYVDDHNANNNTTATQGKEIGDDETTYEFNILSEGNEFSVDNDSGIITLYPSNFSFASGISSIPKGYTIGITYTREDGTIIGNAASTPVRVKILHKMNEDSTDPEWDLMVRNIYSLGMQNIKNENFDLNVFTENADGTANYNALDSLGLDQMNLNEYLQLDTNTDGVIDGSDATVNLDAGYIVFPFIKPFLALGDSIIYYEETINYNEFINYISAKGDIGQDEINLRSTNILPGSVVVKINGNKKKENVDYLVDYEMGIVTFLIDEAKASDADIDISYQYRPIFVVDNKTILGLRADMEFSDNFSLGGTFIYQSETVKEDRPKIFNENRSIILSDIDGSLEFEMPFMTRLIDWLPLIKTDEPSTVNLSGEIAMSVPRIYGSDKQHDKKEAYIDDMESILDTYPLGVSRPTWDPASVPTDKYSGQQINFGKAHLNFYNPNGIYMKEVYDPSTLSEDEEKDEISVLACKIKPVGLGMPGVNNKYWAGVMKYVGNEMDFSEKKYIEFLVKVDTLTNNYLPKPVTMHIDLGVVSEDFYKPGESNEPDKEDGIVTPDGLLDYGEDVGLDGIADGEAGDDPDDNYDNEAITVFNEEEFPHINGTEGNGSLDSEDLNEDGVLNTTEYYFEYSAVINAGVGFEGNEYLESQYNGWRLYRIPISEANNYDIISNTVGKTPDLDKISYARVWFEVEDSTRVKLVSLDLVGNKWVEDGIFDEEGNTVSDENETMLVGIVDNQKDQHYKPAPYTMIKKDGEDTLEQSLIIDYQNLDAGHYGLATQEYTESVNLITYAKLRLWAYLEQEEGEERSSDADTLIIRMGANEYNYYQIEYPITAAEYKTEMERSNWEEIEIVFSDLTQLKNLADEDSILQLDNMTFSLVGAPTLTNTRILTVGLKANDRFSGRLYIDDIRVADPYEKVGFAARSSLTVDFADFSDLTLDLLWRTDNFLANATRVKTPSYVRTLEMNVTNNYELNKFLPAEWGISLPVRLRRSQTLGIPRFKSNGTSDILREDLSDEDQEREKNKSLTKRAEVSFSQNKTPASKILAYTIKNTTLSGYVQDAKTSSSTSADSTITIDMKHGYRFSLPKEDADLKLFGNYYFYYFPQLLENQIIYDDILPHRWYWQTTADSLGNHWAKTSNTTRSKSISTISNINYALLSDIAATYKLSTKRNLLLRKELYDVNVGTETTRTQTMSLDYNPQYLDKIFAFDAGVDVTYDEDHVRSGTIDTLYYEGNVIRNISGNLTLKNRDLLQSLAVWVDEKLRPATRDEDKIPEAEPTGEGLEKEEKEALSKEKDQAFSTPDEKSGEPGSISSIPEEDLGELSQFGEFGGEPGKEEERGEFQPGGDGTNPGIPPDGKKPKGKEGEEAAKPKEPQANILSRFIAYIARLDNVRVTYTNYYKTTYDDRAERPEFLYQIGLPHILDETGDDKEIDLKNNTDKITLSSSFPILNILTTTWGYSKEFKRTYSSNDQVAITTIFPNVSVSLMELEKLLHAENFLTSSRLSSSYMYSASQSGEINFKKPDTEQIRLSLSPLLGWTGNWKGNLSTIVNVNYSQTNSINHYTSYDAETQSTIQSLNSSLSWSFAQPKGLKILFFKRTKLKNEFNTELSFSAEDTVTKTKGQDGKWEKSVNKINYTLTPEASYEFNNNISGGLTSSYELQNDRKSKSTVSIFQLGIFIEVIF